MPSVPSHWREFTAQHGVRSGRVVPGSIGEFVSQALAAREPYRFLIFRVRLTDDLDVVTLLLRLGPWLRTAGEALLPRWSQPGQVVDDLPETQHGADEDLLDALLVGHADDLGAGKGR